MRNRNARKEANDELRKLLKDGEGVSEDAIKNAEIDVQALTDKYVKQIEGMLEYKETEIMTV